MDVVCPEWGSCEDDSMLDAHSRRCCLERFDCGGSSGTSIVDFVALDVTV